MRTQRSLTAFSIISLFLALCDGAPAPSSVSSALSSSSDSSALISSSVSSALPSSSDSSVLISSISSAFASSSVSSVPASSPTFSTPVSSSASSTPASSVVSSALEPSTVLSAPETTPTVPYASDDPNAILWTPQDIPADPEPVRGSLGAPVLAPQDTAIAQQNPDLLAPPTTDSGSVGNAKWPFTLSHNRLQTGGWARQQNQDDLPAATAMAGVNMRLEAGAIRELHWHSTAEWAYVLKGSVQISAINSNGQNYVATVNEGDLWYFPAGVGHSLQATDALPEGAEFILVLDSGAFDEDATFSLSDWLAHVPKEVLAKNAQVDISAFDHIPSKELYIFPSNPPLPDSDAPQSPQGPMPEPLTFEFSKVPVTQLPGGTVKIADSTTFKASQTIAVAELTIEPGAIRELHWHPGYRDEWGFVIEGTGRMSLFAADGNSRTFDYQAGDVSYVPAFFGHYLENTGNTTLRFLEIFKTDTYADISLNQWLALTPPATVEENLNLDAATVAHFNKTKSIVV
ncbi:hypothetical protein NM688_g1854 [Phlebia brevispora]|uniref:Uncharacterized protein n=1 Tax=Phlebia brevispora TaxID=194682 RepID=A0ACC1TAJ0_9APHY|nr:hypothetical protein NM688_g1854 [Phlebia brevispora]